MQGGNVGADGRVERLCITDADSLGSLGLQERVEDLGREDIGSVDFVKGGASIIPQLDRLRGILLWQYPRQRRR